MRCYFGSDIITKKLIGNLSPGQGKMEKTDIVVDIILCIYSDAMTILKNELAQPIVQFEILRSTAGLIYNHRRFVLLQ